MTFLQRHLKLIGVAASCAAIGAGASAIASAGAATSANAPRHSHARHGLARVLARAVHEDLVVATKTGFKTLTVDRGFVLSVSGQQLTLREGTKRATYKTLTLTIPADARVRDDRRKATLGDLKSGQRVIGVQGLKRAVVSAHDVRAS